MKALRWLVLPLLALALVSSDAQSISAADAKNHIGKQETVCGKIVSEHTASGSRGMPTFINLDAPYPDEVFTIVIWERDRARVGAMPKEGSRTCATGIVQQYRGVPEIVVRSGSQLSRNGSSASAVPSGATARCRDGSYSYSQHHQGTCSHHGGVAEWLQ